MIQRSWTLSWMQQLDELLVLSLRGGMFIFCVGGEGFEYLFGGKKVRMWLGWLALHRRFILPLAYFIIADEQLFNQR